MTVKSASRNVDQGGTEQDQKKVILKGENHASREDYEEELELMKEEPEAIVLERGEERPEWRITEGWFQQALTGMSYVMNPLYVSKETVVELANMQGVDLYFTRENEAEVLRNSPRFVRWFSALSYFILLPSSVLIGLSTGVFTGAVVLFAGLTIPVMAIRYYNTYLNQSNNRDELIAQKIQKALETNQSVLTIVGTGHVEGVMDALPSEFDVEYYPTKSKNAPVDGIWDITVRLFQMVSLLFFLYFIILLGVVNFVLPFL